MTRLPWEPPTVTSDPRTGTDAREDERWPVIAAALDAHLDYQHADCDDSCGNRWEEAQYRDALADAVLAALAAVPAPTDEGRAREALSGIVRLLDDYADHGSIDRSVASEVRIRADRVLAAAVPASAPTGETREGRP